MRKLTLEDMHRLAESRGFKFLSKEYKGNHIKHEWGCKEGHIWWAEPNSIKQGYGCPHCAGLAKSNIKEMHKLAEKFDIKCLSTEYINSKTKLTWQCKRGHPPWETKPDHIKAGHLCPYCACNVKLTIEDMQKYAETKKGKCLSTEYVNSNTKLLWQCEDGHIWKAKPGHILADHWCPECSVGVTERICRRFFEIIFNREFPKKKPKWLISPRGSRMELDGYCEKLGLAFEYQGSQHYIPHKTFHKERSLEELEEYDKLKRGLCTNNKVALIEVPYTVKPENMQDYILDECRKKQIQVPSNQTKIDYRELDVYSKRKLLEMQHLAESKGGRCLSKVYINSNTPLEWECKEGHLWKAKPSHIKSGHWCSNCYGNKKLTIEYVQKVAESRGGKCLSKEHINSNTKLRWQCKEGHQWEATPSNVCKKNGTWCQKCYFNRRKN